MAHVGLKGLSYGSRCFAAYDCWTQTSVAGNAARQRLLIAINHGVKHAMWKLKRNIAAEFYTVWKETLLPTKRILWDCCRNVGHFLCGVERAKCYANVYFLLYRQQPEMDNQSVDFAYPWKNFCGRPCLCCLCLQSNICFVLRYK